MIDLFANFIQNWYLPNKAEFSRNYARGQRKAKLPLVHERVSDGKATPSMIRAVNAECGKLRYKLDPLSGLQDYYNHPEFTEWRHQNRQWDMPCDCDDFAVYAVALLRECGVSDVGAWVWNLIINPGNQVTQAWANHVICGVSVTDSKGIQWVGIIDTNTAAHKKVFWFKGNKQTAQAKVLAKFCKIYNVNYYKLIGVPFPFEN